MKKRYLILAAGMVISMGLAAGCSSPVKAETEALEEVQTEVLEEVQTEALEEQTEALEEEQSEAPAEAEAVMDGTEENGSEEAAVESETVRIWGAIRAVEDGSMTVDNQSPLSSPGEMIFMIDPENTLVLDAVNGYPVTLEDVELGSFEAYLGPAMTMSIPPQTTPELVFVNIPEDFYVPHYVVANGALEELGGRQTLITKTGIAYPVEEDVEILPYLTRNIVTAEDITEDTRCMLWLNEDGNVQKLVLFAE